MYGLNGFRTKVVYSERTGLHKFIIHFVTGKFGEFGLRYEEPFYILEYYNGIIRDGNRYFFKSYTIEPLMELVKWIKKNYMAKGKNPARIWKIRKNNLYQIFEIAKKIVELGSYTKAANEMKKNSSYIRFIGKKFGIIRGRNYTKLIGFSKYLDKVDIMTF